MDWNAFSHAYGPAGDLEPLFEQLKNSDDPAAALDQIGNRICHQGSVTPATAPAVVRLIEIVGDDSLRVKNEIIDWLICIFLAEGGGDAADIEGSRTAICEKIPVFEKLRNTTDQTTHSSISKLMALVTAERL